MEKENVIKKLSEKIQGEAIQRTKAVETKKGYDTDGYGYQYIVDRLNDVCGGEWGYTWSVIKELEGEYRSGTKFHEVTVRVDIWVMDRSNVRSCVGGHISVAYADALKGAITNGFKKTAAFWGAGRDAYAGTIDEDNRPLPDSMDNVANKKTAVKKEKSMKERIADGISACERVGIEIDRGGLEKMPEKEQLDMLLTAYNNKIKEAK